jgi:manganese/zinc/iron transport system permease protein
VLWKELKIVSFDPELAESQGYHSNLIHYLLMAMVAGVTVAAFEAVGSILVVAMLIVPAATAHLLTDKLSVMVLLSALIGIACAVVGRDAASHYSTSVPGMMAVVAGILFAVAVLFAPRHGYLIKVFRQWSLGLRIIQEDCLALLYRWQEGSPGKALSFTHAIAALGGGALPRIALWSLSRDGRVKSSAGTVALTEVGSKQAQTLVKSHRLWESYLTTLGLPADHVHAPADRTEHFLNEKILREVANEIEHPHTDPHGRPIPRREGSRVDLDKIE